MKNKKLILPLVAILALVWINIIRKYLANQEVNNEVNLSVVDQNTYSVNELIDTTHYSLELNYKDPFLNQRPHSRPYSNKTPKKSSKVPGKVTSPKRRKRNTQAHLSKPKNNWPNLSFGGLIYDNNDKIGILSINQTEYLVHEKDSLQSFKIDQIYSDSLIISNKVKEKKTIYLK